MMIIEKEILPTQAKEILHKYTSKIPKTAVGADRFSHLIENFSEILIDDKYVLMEIVNDLVHNYFA